MRPGVVGLIALVWALPLALGPPLGSSDVYSYVAHGELASRGLDPGESAPLALGPDAPALQSVDPIWRGVVSAYGPAATALSEGAVRVSVHSVAGAVLVWRALAAAGVALAGVAVVALARRTGRNPTDALVLAVAGPLTLVQLVGGVHNEAVMIGLLAAGLAAGTSGHRAVPSDGAAAAVNADWAHPPDPGAVASSAGARRQRPAAASAVAADAGAASSSSAPSLDSSGRPAVPGLVAGRPGTAPGTEGGGRRLLPVHGPWLAGVILCALGAAVKVPAFAGVVFLGWLGDDASAAPAGPAGPAAPVTPARAAPAGPAAYGAAVALVRRLVRTAVAVVVGLATMAAVSVASGAGWGWLHGVNAGSNVTTLLSVSTTIGLVLNWLAGQPRHSLHGPVAAVRALVLAAGAAAAVVLLWRVPRRPLAAALAALGIALTVVALAGASVQPWYLAWGLPALAVALAGRPARAWLIGAVVAAASTQPKGGGLVRNLGSFHGPALVGLVLLAAGAVVYARRRLRPPPLAQPATRSA